MAKKKKAKGGLGRTLLLLLCLVAVAGVAVWYFAPDTFNEQLDRLKNLVGQ